MQLKYIFALSSVSQFELEMQSLNEYLILLSL